MGRPLALFLSVYIYGSGRRFTMDASMKLALAFLAPFAVTFAAAAQTTATTPVHHSTSTSTTAKAATGTTSAPPRVVGIPHTLYALKYIDTKVGTGALAEPNKWYTVHYTGYFTDGKKFDSSYDRKEPITFPYGAKRVITGWDTGFEGMHIGGKRRLFVPYQLGYGPLGNPGHGMPAKANLVFDVELISISDTPPASMMQRQGAPPAGARPGGAPGAAAPGTPLPTPKPGSNAPGGQEPAPATAPAPGTKPAVDPATNTPTKPATDPTAPATAPTTPPTPPSGK